MNGGVSYKSIDTLSGSLQSSGSGPMHTLVVADVTELGVVVIVVEIVGTQELQRMGHLSLMIRDELQKSTMPASLQSSRSGSPLHTGIVVVVAEEVITALVVAVSVLVVAVSATVVVVVSVVLVAVTVVVFEAVVAEVVVEVDVQPSPHMRGQLAFANSP